MLIKMMPDKAIMIEKKVREVTKMINPQLRCGFKIVGRRSEKQAKRGVGEVLWRNMACTGPWSGDFGGNYGEVDLE